MWGIVMACPNLCMPWQVKELARGIKKIVCTAAGKVTSRRAYIRVE